MEKPAVHLDYNTSVGAVGYSVKMWVWNRKNVHLSVVLDFSHTEISTSALSNINLESEA